MLTQDIFKQHKHDYTVYRKSAVIDDYGNETNDFTAGGTINVMFTPLTDEASIQTYGEKVVTMKQAIVYDDVTIEEHDQVDINGKRYEIVTIQEYPSYRLIKVNKI